MKSSIDIDQIIINSLSGNVTDFEKKELEKWSKQSEKHAHQLEELTKLWDERSVERKTINASEVKRRIWKQGVEQRLNSRNSSMDTLFVKNLIFIIKDKKVFFLKISLLR